MRQLPGWPWAERDGQGGLAGTASRPVSVSSHICPLIPKPVLCFLSTPCSELRVTVCLWAFLEESAGLNPVLCPSGGSEDPHRY